MSITMTLKQPIVLQQLLLREEGQGLYGGTCLLTYETLPQGLSLEEPEFQFFAALILKGWQGPKLTIEFAELALEEMVPPELSRKKLVQWLAWFATEVKFGF